MAFLVDFDETTSLDNVSAMLIARYARDEWLYLHAFYRRQRIGLRQYQEGAFLLTSAPPSEMGAYAAEHARLRPGFVEFVKLCKERDIPVAIVSNGLDFYVKSFLEKHGVGDLPVHAVGVKQGAKRLEFDYPYATPDCFVWGNCKCQVVMEYERQGKRIVFIGDGGTDECPSERARFVFARRRLLDYCQTYDLPHVPLKDFNQVVQAMGDPLHPMHRALGDGPQAQQEKAT